MVGDDIGRGATRFAGRCRRLARWAAAVAVAGGVAAAAPAAAVECPDERESAALFVRSLQTELMVAALTCQARDDYNSFASRFRDDLTRSGKLMKAYFGRAYGGSRALDRFVTELANEASALGMAQGTAYCDGARALFETVLALDASELEGFSARHAVAVHETTVICDARVSGVSAGK